MRHCALSLKMRLPPRRAILSFHKGKGPPSSLTQTGAVSLPTVFPCSIAPIPRFISTHSTLRSYCSPRELPMPLHCPSTACFPPEPGTTVSPCSASLNGLRNHQSACLHNAFLPSSVSTYQGISLPLPSRIRNTSFSFPCAQPGGK